MGAADIQRGLETEVAQLAVTAVEQGLDTSATASTLLDAAIPLCVIAFIETRLPSHTHETYWIQMCREAWRGWQLDSFHESTQSTVRGWLDAAKTKEQP